MDLSGVNLFDVAVLGMLAFGALMGMSSGLIYGLFYLGAWVGAAIVAWKAAPLAQPQLEQVVAAPEIAYFASLLGSFVIALIVLTIFAGWVGKAVQASSFRKPDRFLGIAFGAICALLVLSVAFLVYVYMARPTQMPPMVESARTYPFIRDTAAMIEPLLPAEFRTRLSPAPPAAPSAPSTPGADSPQGPAPTR
jgi:uncharacterized membrane protein required for colicin V production